MLQQTLRISQESSPSMIFHPRFQMIGFVSLLGLSPVCSLPACLSCQQSSRIHLYQHLFILQTGTGAFSPSAPSHSTLFMHTFKHRIQIRYFILHFVTLFVSLTGRRRALSTSTADPSVRLSAGTLYDSSRRAAMMTCV
ncbi:hypothetical protein AMECASPLE_028347 [Ameca splendens]|uniref:Uncharacterized protein n=1 Tax=Ameca splendens TaxID=208324 RepID=A0ABV0ZR89_9TELE